MILPCRTGIGQLFAAGDQPSAVSLRRGGAASGPNCAKNPILAARIGKAASRALIAISDQLEAARAEAVSIAEQSSEAIARLLMSCFATAFPALCARHGQHELTALLREILPALHREPNITVRISPRISAELATEVHALDAELAKRVRLLPTDALSPGDARIDWENGAATRDAASLWRQIENILAPAGLLNSADPLSAPGPARAEHAAKEHALVE